MDDTANRRRSFAQSDAAQSDTARQCKDSGSGTKRRGADGAEMAGLHLALHRSACGPCVLSSRAKRRIAVRTLPAARSAHRLLHPLSVRLPLVACHCPNLCIVALCRVAPHRSVQSSASGSLYPPQAALTSGAPAGEPKYDVTTGFMVTAILRELAFPLNDRGERPLASGEALSQR